MEPQEIQQTEQPIINTAVTGPKKKSKIPILIIFILLVGLLACGYYAYSLNKTLKTKNNTIISKDNEIQSTKDELASAKTKIEELDSPTKKVNDAKRKSDLTKFLAKVSEYANNHNGTFPSTEPTFFAKEFVSQYITGKIDNFIDPVTKKAYEFTPVAKVQTPPGVTLGTIQYQWPGKCAGTEFDDNATVRQSAARLILESGDIYCLDS